MPIFFAIELINLRIRSYDGLSRIIFLGGNYLIDSLFYLQISLHPFVDKKYFTTFAP